jgi:arylsulfatase A-like enzyme
MEDKGPFLYDEILRVPLVARVPGTAGGRRSDAPVYNMDLMPTILELAGCDVPRGLDAVSLAGVVSGRASRVREDDAVWVEYHGHQTPCALRALRTRSAKYVLNPCDVDELYDLTTDPGELRNLAEDPAGAGLLRQMRSRMLERMRSTGDPLLKFFVAERMHA